MVLFGGRIGLVFDGDCSVGPIPSRNNNINFPIASYGLNHLLFIKLDLPRLVIVNNGHSRSGVSAPQFLLSVRGEQLHPEVFIWLPVLVIVDEHLDDLECLAVIEVQGLNQLLIVFSCLGLIVHCFH